jgi:hypothetical protein
VPDDAHYRNITEKPPDREDSALEPPLFSLRHEWMANMNTYKLRRFAAGAIAVLGLAGCASPCLAAPVTFEFTGTVTQFNSDPADPFFGGNVKFGTPFFGAYTFDSAAADAIPDAGSGSYTSPANTAPFQWSFAAGPSGIAVAGPINIGVVNGAADAFTMLGCVESDCSGLTMELFFEDLSGLVFSSDALPLDAPLLNAFQVATFALRGPLRDNEVEILGQLTSLRCTDGCVPTTPAPTPVPEPTTLLLCLTGMSVFIPSRSRRKS